MNPCEQAKGPSVGSAVTCPNGCRGAVMIEPIVLGGGKGIFPTDDAAHRFELVSATTAGTGVQVCRYQRAR